MAPIPVSPVTPIDCHTHAACAAAQARPKGKKIFVFCDGTGNKFSAERSDRSANSNVVKLYIALRVTDDQVAYYHPGVGTMGDPAVRGAIPHFWSKVKGLAFGAGFKANVLDAYRYLMQVYNDHDEIFIFGFSRGAYTARALGGLLHGYGLLCRGNEGHLEYVWNMFHQQVEDKRANLKIVPDQRTAGASNHSVQRNFAFLETYSRKVTIRFMGLWDTVSSVGWIYDPVRLLDMAQNPSVLVGRHLVSIDERRAFYRDNLWGPPVPIDHPEWPQELRDQGIQQDIIQVWFPGVHSDVGGSYPQKDTAPANETLLWMIGELKNHGVELCQERIDMILGTPSGVYSADHVFTPPPAKDHCLHESLKGPLWWLLQCFPQQYYDKDGEDILWRVPYAAPRSIPHGAIIHGSAVRRMQATATPTQPAYQPRNLTLAQLTELAAPASYTTANLVGCFVYQGTPVSANSIRRRLRLILGWITFGLFWAILLLIAWSFLALVLLLATPLLWVLAHPVAALILLFHKLAVLRDTILH